MDTFMERLGWDGRSFVMSLNVEPACAGTISGSIGRALQPILGPIGISPKLSVALIFGFIAKEIVLGGLAVIYATKQDARGLGF